MSKNKFAKSTEEFDRRFDEGEDIHDLIDMTKAKIIRHGRKVRITLDIAEELVQDIDQIRQAAKLSVISGVTTNPSLVSKEATADYQGAIKEICSIIPGPVSAEVLVEGVEPMIEQAKQIASWAPNIAIKIPATTEGLSGHALAGKPPVAPCHIVVFFVLRGTGAHVAAGGDRRWGGGDDVGVTAR